MKQSIYDYYNSHNLPIEQIRNKFNSQTKSEQQKIYLYILSKGYKGRTRAYQLIEADVAPTVIYKKNRIYDKETDKITEDIVATHHKNNANDRINTLLHDLCIAYSLPKTISGFSMLFSKSVDSYTLDKIGRAHV